MNSSILKQLIVASIFITNTSCASQSNRVDKDIFTYDKKIENLKFTFKNQPSNPQSKEWVQDKIDNMVQIDQYMRFFWNTPFANSYSQAEKEDFNKKFSPKAAAIDSQNTSDLKELIKIYSWFKISEFGIKTDNQAWLIVQHADHDHEFQESVLHVLETLWPIGETSPSNYAYLYDRVASSFGNPNKRKPQRYGTQGHCIGTGQWEPWPMENPDKIDDLRKSVGLETMEQYKKIFKDICH